MKTGRTLQELAAEIERQNEVKEDYLVDSKALTVSVLPQEGALMTVETDDTYMDLGIRETAHGQVSASIGIPSRYYHRLLSDAPELWTRNVNHWLHAEPKKRMLRTLDGDCRAYLSNAFRRLDNYDFAKVVLPTIRDMSQSLGTTVQSCEITDDYLYLKCAHTLLTGEVSKGQAVMGGFCLRNSEVGKARSSIALWLKVLACSNGMMVDQTFSKTHLGRRLDVDGFESLITDETKQLEDKVVFNQARDIIMSMASKEAFEQTLQRLREGGSRPITGNPGKAVEALRKSTSLLHESDEGDILRHLVEGGDLTCWGLSNAVTRTAEDLASYDRATDFEALGGQIALMKDKAWAAIATAE